MVLFGINPIYIVGIIIFFILILLLPRFLRMRIISTVTRFTEELEGMVSDCKIILVKLSNEKGKPNSDPGTTIDNYLEFFVVPPVDLDPQGVVHKLQKILEMGEDRFRYMALTIAPHADPEWRANIIMTLKSTLALNTVAKMVRHNLELARKTGNLQILLMLQMSLPLLMRIMRAQLEGTKCFAEGKPIGDGLGPLVVGMLLKDVTEEELEERDELIVARTEIEGVDVIIARANGPGARVGKIGMAVTSLIEEENIKRIITVDAAVKLEGEESGAVAEGIGVVVGGPGVDRWIIEEELLKRDLQTDAIVVKMSPEEAIGRINQKLMDASKKAVSVVNESILRSKSGSRILVVGVGNSCGIPNIIPDPDKIDFKKKEIQTK
ncbi:MAG: DUF1512 family protein [Methanobacteriaceae archaeon]